MRMVTPRLLIATCAVALVAGSLAACTPSAPTPTRTPVATHSQAFASDADALKAATEAYAAYLKMSDTIAQEGGANPERIKPFVTGDSLAAQLRGFSVLYKWKLRANGSTTFDTVSLQHQAERAKGSVDIDIYMCTDVTKVRVVNTDGADVTPPDRVARLPIQVSLTSRSPGERLRLARSDSWPGTNFC
jgi:hypothetical protein